MQKHCKLQAVTAENEESRDSVEALMALNKNCRSAGYAHDYMLKLRQVCKGDVKQRVDVVETHTVRGMSGPKTTAQHTRPTRNSWHNWR